MSRAFLLAIPAVLAALSAHAYSVSYSVDLTAQDPEAQITNPEAYNPSTNPNGYTATYSAAGISFSSRADFGVGADLQTDFLVHGNFTAIAEINRSTLGYGSSGLAMSWSTGTTGEADSYADYNEVVYYNSQSGSTTTPVAGDIADGTPTIFLELIRTGTTITEGYSDTGTPGSYAVTATFTGAGVAQDAPVEVFLNKLGTFYETPQSSTFSLFTIQADGFIGIPEPASAATLGAGFLGLCWARRRAGGGWSSAAHA